MASGCSQAGTGSPCPDAVSATALSWTGRCGSLVHQEVACYCCTSRELSCGKIGRKHPWCPSSVLPPWRWKQEKCWREAGFTVYKKDFAKTCWPESSAFFFAETGIHQSHLCRKRRYVDIMWSSCWSNCGVYDTAHAQFRPLQAWASWYPTDPPEQRNLSGTYSSRVTSVGSLSVSLAFSTQLCLCKKQN